MMITIIEVTTKGKHSERIEDYHSTVFHTCQFLSVNVPICLLTPVVIIKERHDHRSVSVNNSNSRTNATANDIL